MTENRIFVKTINESQEIILEQTGSFSPGKTERIVIVAGEEESLIEDIRNAAKTVKDHWERA